MKKLMCSLLALACVLGLTACQSGGADESKATWTESHAQDILAAGAFSEELETLDLDTLWMLYKLGDYGLERESLTGGVCHRSAGATCEELAVLIFDGEEAANGAMEALEAYVQSQITANADYRPAELPKLENAWLAQRGYTVLLAVANDLEAAKSAVGE